jgi:hypothetical protein
VSSGWPRDLYAALALRILQNRRENQEQQQSAYQLNDYISLELPLPGSLLI